MVIFFQSLQRKYLENNLVVDKVCCCGKKKSNVAQSNELKKFFLNMDVSLNVSKLVFLFIK